MDNVYSKGSEYPHLTGPPANEDYSFLVVVRQVSEYSTAIAGTKVWDEDGAAGKLFYARVYYPGKTGSPQNQISVGSTVIYHRVGTQNRDTGEDFSVFHAPVVTNVLDLGDGTAQEVKFSSTGTATAIAGTVHAAQPADPASFFHDSTYPWESGRIYSAILVGGARWIVFVTGHGPGDYSFAPTAVSLTFTLSTDTSGKVTGLVIS